MTAKYFAILTSQGAAKLANATALGTRLNLTQMAVGDGNGALPTPDPAQTRLVNQKRIASLNMLSVDPQNSSQIIAEQIIPENEGGFWIREIGLYDDTGVLIAVANCPETYKPQLQEGSGRTQTIRMILIVSNADAVTLKIDPAVVLATRKYVDDKVIEVKAYADNLMAAHLAAANPHNQYAPKDSPALTGKPTAPTAAQASNDTQLATTAFVKAALAALVDSSPAALDTLNELAAALGDDPNFAATMKTELSKKMDKARNGADIPDVAAFLANLGLGELALAGTITGVFDTNGYLKIPVIIGGAKRTLMVQWGNAGNAASATTETFYPVPFPNKVFQVIAGGFQVGGNQQAYVTVNSSNPLNRFAWNGFYANGGQAPILSTVANQVGCQYIVIGW
ncbi:phage tail protein [Atlantibacter subterranea]|uniref:Phage tail protein n=1 Tax=Atlantibacter subterraneus TaxID=255519 RepID=A0ABU4E2I4_9ENTR|nr:phage tail protein [Atlantibacter subterranea]MDV7023313.1 phage tail protein [Atlantibacter subterranea]MDZ5666393.1 phage tail protein [Atlantibacter hermannii]